MHRSIRDIPGFLAGHATLAEAGTGCTAIVCPKGATGAVDVRGGAPATRETDLLRPEETVNVLHCVMLSGGSAYGLAAASGAAEELERRGVGLDVGVGIVPIVSSACLFDLVCGSATVRPGMEEGAQSVANAFEEKDKPLARGNAGAGCGCTVGKLEGPERSMKSGLGEDVESAGELLVGALSAVNAVGNICDPETGKPLSGLLSEDGTHIVNEEDALIAASTSLVMPLARTNTTISCIVTNARLTKAEATKVAQMAADGYAHAIRPTHTTNDGDTIFVMASGSLEAPVDLVGTLAVRAIERAIADAAREARPAFGLKAASSFDSEI